MVKPIIDTIKHTKDGKHVNKTIDRNHLMAALTPQMFPYGQLNEVLKKAIQLLKLYIFSFRLCLFNRHGEYKVADQAVVRIKLR